MTADILFYTNTPSESTQTIHPLISIPFASDYMFSYFLYMLTVVFGKSTKVFPGSVEISLRWRTSDLECLFSIQLPRSIVLDGTLAEWEVKRNPKIIAVIDHMSVRVLCGDVAGVDPQVVFSKSLMSQILRCTCPISHIIQNRNDDTQNGNNHHRKAWPLNSSLVRC